MYPIFFRNQLIYFIGINPHKHFGPNFDTFLLLTAAAIFFVPDNNAAFSHNAALRAFALITLK